MYSRQYPLSEAFIAEYDISEEPPPPDALFWTMWNNSKDIAEKIYKETSFIEGIIEGNMHPPSFGGFFVSDAYYCFKAANHYLAAECRAEDQTLKKFLYEKYQSYLRYNKYFPEIWRVREAGGVVPYASTRAYSQYEADIVSHQHPAYCMIVMLPCEYLWYWLAHTVEEGHPEAKQKLYGFWLKENGQPPKGAYAMGNFIEWYRKNHPDEINEDNAIHIYRMAMEYEHKNFLNVKKEVLYWREFVTRAKYKAA